METYKTTGVCAKEIQFEVEDNKIKSVNFIGGCPGNLIGISHLVKGMEVEDAINKLKGIHAVQKTHHVQINLHKP